MAALSANTVRESVGDDTRHVDYPVVGSDIIYAGGMVMIDSNGYAAPAAAAASNQGVVGIATEKVDNSSGSSGDKTVRVAEGTFKFDGTTLSQSSLGAVCYAEDDQTIDETQGTNEPLAGIIERIDATNNTAHVRMGLTISKVNT